MAKTETKPMRRIFVYFIVAYFGICYLAGGSYPGRFLKDDIASATVIKRSLYSKNETMVIQSRQDLDQIQDCLRWIWKPIIGVGSYEGYPRYSMQITYRNGTKEKVIFTRHEMIPGNHPPQELLAVMDRLLPEKLPTATEASP